MAPGREASGGIPVGRLAANRTPLLQRGQPLSRLLPHHVGAAPGRPGGDGRLGLVAAVPSAPLVRLAVGRHCQPADAGHPMANPARLSGPGGLAAAAEPAAGAGGAGWPAAANIGPSPGRGAAQDRPGHRPGGHPGRAGRLGLQHHPEQHAQRKSPPLRAGNRQHARRRAQRTRRPGREPAGPNRQPQPAAASPAQLPDPAHQRQHLSNGNAQRHASLTFHSGHRTTRINLWRLQWRG